MTATTAPESLRDVKTAAAAFRDRLSAAEIARRLGVATSTVTRFEDRFAELLDWSAAHVLTLASTDELLARALRTFLAGEQAAAPATVEQIVADIEADMDATSNLHRTVFKATADGDLTLHELQQIRNALLARQAVDAKTLVDIEAGIAAKVEAVRGR